MSVALTFRITLETPALFSALEGEPNSAVSHPYIPGSTLRGMGVAAWLRENGTRDLDLTDAFVQDLFFNGAIRWLNAYPLYDGERCLPVPRTWLRPKYGERGKIYTQSFSQIPEGSKPKTPDGFFHRVNGSVRLIEPERALKIHVQRDRQLGRAVKSDDGTGGTIYRYDGLAAGQVFGAAVVCETVEQAEQLKSLIETHPQAALGGARTAGYGRVTLSDFTVRENWQEAPLGASQKENLQVTLLSDVLLRNDDGQPCADAPTLLSALNKYLGNNLVLKEAYLTSDMVGGFNRKWGLPLPQAPALKKGSVVILSGTADQDKLEALAETGIGERRAEGYGRLAFNWILDVSELTVLDNGIANQSSEDGQIQAPSDNAVRDVVRRLMHQRLAQAAIADSVTLLPVGAKVDSLKRTQINRLRAEVRAQLAAKTPSADFSGFFTALRETARKQFARQRIGDQRGISTWISSLQVQNECGKVKTKYTHVWQPQDDIRAKLMVIDAVLARMAKLSKEADGE